MDEIPQPKITVTEAVAVIGSLAVLDTIDILLLFVGLDDFFIIDTLAFPVTQLYFRMKGVRGNYAFYMNLAEVVPYVGKLPLRTIGGIMTVWRDRNPKASPTPESIPAASAKANVIRPKFGDAGEDKSEAA